MKIELAQNLAWLHHKYGIYDSIPKFTELRNHEEYNILNFYKEFETLKAFNKFFEEYFKNYDSKPTRNISESKRSINTKQARGVDFPYIGDNVITTGKAKFMFIFEGSLSNNKEDKGNSVAKLSITVLSNFWHLEKDEEIDTVFNNKIKFWNKSNFLKIKKQLCLNQYVIDNCFVTDAVRLAREDDHTKIDLLNNRMLIWEEKKLLKPNLVICVGNKAKEIVGMQYSELNTKFHHIPFPSNRKNKDKKAYDDTIYAQLATIYKKI